jgi:hypothetical protein
MLPVVRYVAADRRHSPLHAIPDVWVLLHIWALALLITMLLTTASGFLSRRRFFKTMCTDCRLLRGSQGQLGQAGDRLA